MHYRAGMMDGVSLEMEKWKKVLERMGHEVKIVAGNPSDKVDIRLKEIGFEDEDYEDFFKRSFEEETLSVEEIERKRGKILEVLKESLSDFDLYIPNNIWSLALSLPLGLALKDFALWSGKPFIAHHHDFWWEREHLRRVGKGHIRRILEEEFPPDIENVVHVTINSIAREELLKRRGLESLVVPNVMDFSRPISREDVGRNIRRDFGIDEGAMVFLQATRITKRKAIEVALEFVKEFKSEVEGLEGKVMYNGERFNGDVILAFSGMCERGEEGYWKRLKNMSEDMGLDILDLSGSGYDFFDLYSVADMITYPTILEGWGNQLLEAMCAKKPIVLFEYEVFLRDIKPHGIRYISLGREYDVKDGLVDVKRSILKEAAREAREILFDEEKYREMVEENFEIGKREFSLEKLEEILKERIFPSLSGR